jgi:hypothetical protein
VLNIALETKKQAWKVGSVGKSTSKGTNPLGALHLTTGAPGATGIPDPVETEAPGATDITPGAAGVGLLGLIKILEIETILPLKADGFEVNRTGSTGRLWADNDPIRVITAIKNRFFINIYSNENTMPMLRKITRKRNLL